jgi:hypothetical protein
MFATLVVQLPSIFEGGSFVVSHNGKKETFKLDYADSAPYSCHYVAHYADCEHEVLPVTSGYRLALVYSLCYMGKDIDQPSVRVFERVGRMVKTMERLPREESLFAVPLEHQYTTKSLGSLGIDALKGKDRALAKSIIRANGWNVLISLMARTDHESGGSPWGGYSDAHAEKGEPIIADLYDADGSDAYKHQEWILDQLELTSVNDDGMVLASEDVVECMWDEESVGSFEHTGNAAATREVTYSTCMLIAYLHTDVFEWICRSSIQSAVDEVVSNPQLLGSLLEFMERLKPTITCANFIKIYALLSHFDPEEDHSFWKSFGTLVGCLDKHAVLLQEVAVIFSSLVKDHGWNDHTKPLLSIFESSLSLPDSFYFSGLAHTVTCLQLLEPIKMDGNMDALFRKYIEGCVSMIGKGQGQAIWENKLLVDFLFRRGEPHHFQFLQEWVLTASLDALSELRSCLECTELSAATESRQAFTAIVEDRFKYLRVADLHERECTLEQAVRCGTPVFSWSMPSAKTSNSTLDAFLRSDQPGPIEIVTGEGISDARELEWCARRACISQSSLLQSGFSAYIVAQGVGKRAGVVVTKTRDYYNAKVAKYEQDINALKEVKEELRTLGVKLEEPDAKRARADVDVIVID